MTKSPTPDGAHPRRNVISNQVSPDRAFIPDTSGTPYRTMSEMFEYIWRDGTPDPAKFAGLDEIDVSHRYAICMVPRSGSTFLAHLLKQTGCFGYPSEWLAIALAEDQARETGSTDWDMLFRRVLARHASPNGVSGIELALAHLLWGRQATGRKQILGRDMRYFYLRRRNIVRQGISMHVAHQSGVLHSFQMTDDARIVQDAVLYDTKAIRNWTKFLHDEEMRWEREFGAIGIEPVRLYYEDIVRRPERVVRLFANILGLPETPLPPENVEIASVGHQRADEWEARYREEDADYLGAMARHRPFVHPPVQMT
ncbi:Stf0 family sulfotransferase [Maricaulis sp.]|uniref:Stf0 family sulfotransferase n=1 Tax=Maricaulis sp. TaxID=1486257 RepID=UPI001B2EF99D|nr:Stf0 family sulfotransferase [Maricaulis sp.]MBO6764150.1 hypothetical protein [Maricaulis sp.]